MSYCYNEMDRMDRMCPCYPPMPPCGPCCFQGPPGVTGPMGPTGPTGPSVTDIAPSIYVGTNNAAQTTTAATPLTFNTPTLLSGMDVIPPMMGNNAVGVRTDGVYQVNFSANVSNSGGIATTPTFALRVTNGTATTDVAQAQETIPASNTENISLSVPVRLNAGNTVTVVPSETGVNVTNPILSVQKIGAAPQFNPALYPQQV